MGPRFALKGYCTYTITYGQYQNIPLLAGLDKMENSAVELNTFVNQVLASTNATKVNLVGHSEGSMMPRYWLKFLGGASKVGKVASVSNCQMHVTICDSMIWPSILTSKKINKNSLHQTNMRPLEALSVEQLCTVSFLS